MPRNLTPRPRRAPRRIEAPIQIAIVDYIRLVAPQLIVLHIPNEGMRSAWGHAHMVRMGLTPGAHDLLLLEEPGLAYLLEVKAPDEQLSMAQIEFHVECRARKIPQAVVRSVNDARDALARFGIRTREAAAA